MTYERSYGRETKRIVKVKRKRTAIDDSTCSYSEHVFSTIGTISGFLCIQCAQACQRIEKTTKAYEIIRAPSSLIYMQLIQLIIQLRAQRAKLGFSSTKTVLMRRTVLSMRSLYQRNYSCTLMDIQRVLCKNFCRKIIIYDFIKK